MSQAQLARLSRLAPGTIGEIERGDYEPSDANRWALATALGPAAAVDAYLLGRGPMPEGQGGGVTANLGPREVIPATEVNRAILRAIKALAHHQFTGEAVPVVEVLGLLERIGADVGIRPAVELPGAAGEESG